MRILVVDDDRAVREALERALALEGYDVELAGDGLAALAAVDRSEPDAVVLDVLMPGADGLEVCRLLRKGQHRVPILMLRRAAPETDAEVLRFADLTFDLGTLRARRGNREFKLSVTEANLLELFMRNPRQVLSRSLVFERIWGRHLGTESNTIDVYVGYLRRKTESSGESRLIHTVRGAGYVLSER